MAVDFVDVVKVILDMVDVVVEVKVFETVLVVETEVLLVEVTVVVENIVTEPVRASEYWQAVGCVSVAVMPMLPDSENTWSEVLTDCPCVPQVSPPS